MKAIIGKHKYYLAVLGLLVFGFIFLSGNSLAHWGDEDWTGYFYDNQETSGLPVLNTPIPSSVNDSTAYINFVKNLYASSDAQEHTAGSYLILTFMGYGPGTPKSKVSQVVTINGVTASVMDHWEKSVRSYAQQGLIRYHWTTPSDFSCRNTFYQPGNKDIADYSECSHTRNQDSIAFFNPDDPSQPVFVIRRICGNPIGDSFGVPVPNKKPQGIIALCISGVANTASIKGYDPDHPGTAVGYKVVHFSTDEYDFGGSTTQSTPDNRTYSGFYPGRDYRLMVKDLDDGEYYDIDPVATYPSNCGAAAASPDCTVFNRTLQPHSAYRFVVFPKDQDYAPTDPAPNPALYIGSHPGWAAYTNPTNPYYGQAAEWFYTNSSDSTYGYSNSFPPPTGPDWVIYSERWQHYDANNNGTLDSWAYARARIVVDNCYSARVTDAGGNCTIGIEPNIPDTGNGVEAGTAFTAHAVITNTGKARLYSIIGGNNLTLTGNGDFPIDVGKPTPLANAGVDIEPGASAGIDFTLAAPSSVGNYNLSGYPDYWNRLALGPSCGFNVAVYEKFRVSVHADSSLSPTVENPDTFSYHTWLRHESGPSADILVADSRAYEQGGSTYAAVSNQNITSYSPDGTNNDVLNGAIDPRPVAAGDRFCAMIRAAYTSGYVGPGGPGDVKGVADSAEDSPPCDEVHNEPYFHILGSDVSAGGGFGSNCAVTPGKGGIHAYTRTTGIQPSGSGGQMAALALDKIFGFSSANLRTSPPSGSLGLAFSNTSNTSGGSSNSPALGGLLGTMGSNSCVPDYFATKPGDQPIDPPASSASGPTIDLSGIDGRHYYEPNGGTLYINSSSGIANGKGIVIYVKGNVVIQDNISFTGAGNYGTPENVPSLYIIAKGGNIYVDKDRTNLDGVFIAQPNGTSGGNIYSCANGTTPLKGLDECRRQLVVNGSFTAQRVYLLRTFGSIRDSFADEYLGKPPLARDCSDSGSTSLGDCAGEIFNFSPEIYLSRPPMPPSSGPTTGKYKYITSLPPIL